MKLSSCSIQNEKNQQGKYNLYRLRMIQNVDVAC